MKKNQPSMNFIFFPGLIISLFITCSDRTPVSVEENTDTQTANSRSVLLPLKVGNEWTFNFKNNSTGSTGFFSWEITGKKELDDQTVYLLKQYFGVTGLSRTLLVSNKTRGLYVHGVISSIGSETIFSSPRLFMKYPLDIGSTFINWEGLKFDLIAIGKRISTEAGNFKSLKFFVYKNDIRVSTWFWIKEIGPAIMMTNPIDPNTAGPIDISTLYSYKIK